MAQPSQSPTRSIFGSLVLIAVVIGGGAAAFALRRDGSRRSASRRRKWWMRWRLPPAWRSAIAETHLKYRTGLAGILEGKFYAALRRVYFSHDMQLVRQSACGTRAGFLLRQRLAGRRGRHIIRIAISVGRLIGSSAGQGNNCVVR